MELIDLRKHVRNLAMLPETEAMVVSCYLTLHERQVKNPNAFEEKTRMLKSALTGQAARDFQDALAPITEYLAEDLFFDSQGVAVFSRAGVEPFFLAAQFRAALPDWLVVDRVPNIYHLMELKDNYDRYVVMISTQESARIMEISLGEVTREVWGKNRELRERVGREWTKVHYQKHRKEQTQGFIKEKVKILEQLMTAGGHTHLILAGHPTMTARVRDLLPKHLRTKLVDVVRVSGKASDQDVVTATIASFLEAEEKESCALADSLVQQVFIGKLAVVGTEASLRALERGHVDVLVLTRDYSPGDAWACAFCRSVSPGLEKPASCPRCGKDDMVRLDIKEEMVRTAEQQGCEVEVVDEDKSLTQLGGVGCLLRFRLPDEYT